MQLHGLSNQWKIRERLFESLRAKPGADEQTLRDIRDERMIDLLKHLECVDGPDLYVGTSHSTLLFATRDVRSESDAVPVDCTAQVLSEVETHWPYRIGFRQIDGMRPTDTWTYEDCDFAQDAAPLILKAMEHALVPPRLSRRRADQAKVDR